MTQITGYLIGEVEGSETKVRIVNDTQIGIRWEESDEIVLNLHEAELVIDAMQKFIPQLLITGNEG